MVWNVLKILYDPPMGVLSDTHSNCVQLFISSSFCISMFQGELLDYWRAIAEQQRNQYMKCPYHFIIPSLEWTSFVMSWPKASLFVSVQWSWAEDPECIHPCSCIIAVYDAFGKLGSDVEGGNVNRPGSVRECLSVSAPHFRGQYCQVYLKQVTAWLYTMSSFSRAIHSVRFITPLTVIPHLCADMQEEVQYFVGICVPDSCAETEVQTLVVYGNTIQCKCIVVDIYYLLLQHTCYMFVFVFRYVTIGRGVTYTSSALSASVQPHAGHLHDPVP